MSLTTPEDDENSDNDVKDDTEDTAEDTDNELRKGGPNRKVKGRTNFPESETVEISDGVTDRARGRSRFLKGVQTGGKLTLNSTNRTLILGGINKSYICSGLSLGVHVEGNRATFEPRVTDMYVSRGGRVTDRLASREVRQG